MRRRLPTAVLAVVSAAVLVAGCGGSSSGGGSGTNESSAAPKTELVDSFHALGNASALTTTLSLDTTSANILHLSTEGGGSAISQQQAAALSSAKLVVSETAPDGKTLSQAAASGSADGVSTKVLGTANGTTYLTAVAADKTLYVQLDLKDLLGLAGMSSEYQTLVVRAGTLPAFVRDFVAGKFVSLPFATVSALEAIIKGAGGSAASQVPDAATLRKVPGQIASAVLDDLTATRSASGTTDQLDVTGNARTLARDVLSAVATSVPALASQINPDSASQVPDRDLHAMVSVTGGAVSRILFDVGQLSPHQKDTLPVTATFSRSAPTISAPSQSTPVNLQDLIAFFSAFAGG